MARTEEKGREAKKKIRMQGTQESNEQRIGGDLLKPLHTEPGDNQSTCSIKLRQ